MIADINYGAYANKEFVRTWFIKNGTTFGPTSIGILANATTVPCINICYWLGEMFGWQPWLIKSLKGIIKFYNYTQIDNKPPNSPI